MFHGLPSLEMIDYQKNSSLGMDIEIALTNLRKLTTVDDRDIVNSKLETVIKKNTNLTFTVVVKKDVIMSAGVYVPNIDANNVLISGANIENKTNRDADVLLAGKLHAYGGVNLAKSIVYGDFCKLRPTFFISEDLLIKGSVATIREATSIILHEIGHVFSYLELLGRTLTTNFVLEEANRRLLGFTEKDKRYKVIREIENEAKIHIKETDALVNSQSTAEITTVVISESINNSYSEIGVNIYDERAFEMLADQFATRHGYGKDLVMFQDKVLRLVSPSHYYDSAKRMRVRAVNTFSALLLSPLLIGLLAAAAMGVVKFGTSNYDTPKKRLEVVRNDINRQLKEPGLTKDEKVAILNDLEEINKVIASMTDFDVTSVKWLFDLVSRKNNRAINIQQTLEQLANSKLNESLARLKLLESSHV